MQRQPRHNGCGAVTQPALVPPSITPVLCSYIWIGFLSDRARAESRRDGSALERALSRNRVGMVIAVLKIIVIHCTAATAVYATSIGAQWVRCARDAATHVGGDGRVE